jgi:integrase
MSIEQNIILAKIDGNICRMPLKEYEAESKKPNVHVYEDQGFRCLDHVESSIKTIEQVQLVSIPPPPEDMKKPVEEIKSEPMVSSQHHGRPKGLHYHYKQGKFTEVLEWEELQKKIEDAHFDLEPLCYAALSFMIGARKGEILDMTVEQFKYDDSTLYVDVGARLKGSEMTQPIPIDRSTSYVESIIKLLAIRSTMKPSKRIIKRFGKIYTGVKKGKDRLPVWKNIERTERWMFRHISRTTAYLIFKKIDPRMYPHYSRLWSLSSIGTSPEGNLVMLKSRSGIKSTQVLNAYLGQSKKQLNRSSEIMTNIMKTPNIAPVQTAIVPVKT